MSKTGSTFPSNYEESVMGRTTGIYLDNRRHSKQNNIQIGQPNNLYLDERQRQMARIQNNKNRDALLLQGGWYNSYPKFEPKGSFNTPLSLNGNTSNCNKQMQGGGLLRTKQVQDYFNKLLQDRKQQLDAQQQMMEGQTNLMPQKVEEGIDNNELININLLSLVQSISDSYFDGDYKGLISIFKPTYIGDFVKYGLSLTKESLMAMRDSLDNIVYNMDITLGSRTLKELKDNRLDYERLVELYGERTEEELEPSIPMSDIKVEKVELIFRFVVRLKNIVNHLFSTINKPQTERKMAFNTFLRTIKVGQVIGRQVKPKTPEETALIQKERLDREIRDRYQFRKYTEDIERQEERQRALLDRILRPPAPLPPAEVEEEEEEEEGAGRRKRKNKKYFLKGGMRNEDEDEEEEEEEEEAEGKVEEDDPLDSLHQQDEEDEARRVLRDLKPELEAYLESINYNYNQALEGAKDEEFRLTPAQVRAEQMFVKGEANQILTYIEDIKNDYNNRYINAFMDTKLNQIYKKITLTSQIISITSKPYGKRIELLRRLEEDPEAEPAGATRAPSRVLRRLEEDPEYEPAESEPAGATGRGKRKLKRKPNKNIKNLLKTQL